LKLLLHTCCAPCAIYPVTEGKNDDVELTGFFYNPNIHPASEYLRRKKACVDYFESEGIELILPERNPGDYFINHGEAPREDRCRSCWGMRLFETARFAKENGFDSFTTTLLGSPYQEHDTLKELCREAAEKSGSRFYYKDFRVGFKSAHLKARMKGIYRQNYCGCVFSLVERHEAKSQKAKK